MRKLFTWFSTFFLPQRTVSYLRLLGSFKHGNKMYRSLPYRTGLPDGKIHSLEMRQPRHFGTTLGDFIRYGRVSVGGWGGLLESSS